MQPKCFEIDVELIKFIVVCYEALRTWSIVNTTGALVKGRYGHSSVYDDTTGLILVHGGYQSQSFSAYLLSDALYAFNPNTSTWYVLIPSLFKPTLSSIY